MEIIPTSFGK